MIISLQEMINVSKVISLTFCHDIKSDASVYRVLAPILLTWTMPTV